jgi:hypothetical protein
VSVPAPFPIPDPDDPDGGEPPEQPEWCGLTAQPMGDAEGRPVTSLRSHAHDPERSPSIPYRGGSMRRRPGIDDDEAEPPRLRCFTFPEMR